MVESDALQVHRRDCSGKWLSAVLRYASHQLMILPSARNNVVADGSRSRLSRWFTSRWAGSRFQKSLHGHAVQGNIWSISKVFRLRGRSVHVQRRLPASSTLIAISRTRDTRRQDVCRDALVRPRPRCFARPRDRDQCAGGWQPTLCMDRPAPEPEHLGYRPYVPLDGIAV
jgi:hypothetical protein